MSSPHSSTNCLDHTAAMKLLALSDKNNKPCNTDNVKRPAKSIKRTEHSSTKGRVEKNSKKLSEKHTIDESQADSEKEDITPWSVCNKYHNEAMNYLQTRPNSKTASTRSTASTSAVSAASTSRAKKNTAVPSMSVKPKTDYSSVSYQSPISFRFIHYANKKKYMEQYRHSYTYSRLNELKKKSAAQSQSSALKSNASNANSVFPKCLRCACDRRSSISSEPAEKEVKEAPPNIVYIYGKSEDFPSPTIQRVPIVSRPPPPLRKYSSLRNPNNVLSGGCEETKNLQSEETSPCEHSLSSNKSDSDSAKHTFMRKQRK